MIITGIEADEDIAEHKARLLGSLLYFIQVFYKARNSRDFRISTPIGRESHHITVCRTLTEVFYGKHTRLILNLPPGHGKSTMLQYFVAWAWAHYPDSKFLYLSYSHDEAAKNTGEIRKIISLPLYRKLFGVEIDPSSSAKDDFKTLQAGTMKAFGSYGAVTGKDAGFPGCDRFSGMLIYDDAHKPSEVFSDAWREGVVDNYFDTVAQRVRSPTVPTVFLAQRLHESDLPGVLGKGRDGYEWSKVILKAVDDAGNVLDEGVRTLEQLRLLEKTSPYVYWAQYQQSPQPPGGGLFKPDDFELLDQDPDLLVTFITADTAETEKTYNDASVFSFWGLYRIEGKINDFAIHCIDCLELRVEPRHLQDEFLSFYSQCSLHPHPPSFAAIEKKSTGVTLLSCLKDIRGLIIRGIERNKRSGSKSDRFMEMQPYIGKRLVSLPTYGKHTKLFIDHMSKITNNNTHRHDDICDTVYDAISIALIDKSVQSQYLSKHKDHNLIVRQLQSKNSRVDYLRSQRWQR